MKAEAYVSSCDVPNTKVHVLDFKYTYSHHQSFIKVKFNNFK